ncbi:MAG: flagellin [Pseudomonadota bacterium]
MTGVFLTQSAQTALSILNGVNREISQLEGVIASGKKINSAADNAAIWTVAQNLQAQQAGYNALAESLDGGKSTISVGRTGAESVVSLLNEIKTEITNSTAGGANTSAIQSTIDGLVAQVGSVVSSASVNGVNLLQNTSNTSGSDTYSILASYYTDSAGALVTQDITVQKTDLQTTAATYGATGTVVANYISANNATIAVGGGTSTISVQSPTIAYGAGYRVTLAGNGSHNLSSTVFEYVAREGDTAADISNALYNQINDHISANNLSADMSVSVNTSSGQITVTNNDADGGDTIGVTLDATTGGTAGGGLSDLTSIDVTTSSGRDAALVQIETLLEAATAAAAAMGSAERRVDIQSQFLTESSAELGKGISALIDADLTSASAKLAAAQAQRDLALEALSIANDRHKSILALFQ